MIYSIIYHQILVSQKMFVQQNCNNIIIGLNQFWRMIYHMKFWLG